MSQSIMIVGAGPGIGQAVAEKFGRAGWTVVLSGRNGERLAALRSTLVEQQINAHAVVADAGDPAAIKAAVAEAGRLAGGLSVVLYNAAALRMQDLFSMSDEDIADDLAVNIAGGLYTIRAAVELFGTDGGTILVTGGALALTPHPQFASLGLGKAAIRNVVQALAAPLAEKGIRIATATVATQVNPGSAEARGVADIFWRLANEPGTDWEAIYPPTAG